MSPDALEECSIPSANALSNPIDKEAFFASRSFPRLEAGDLGKLQSSSWMGPAVQFSFTTT
jgi:hypothetical protein